MFLLKPHTYYKNCVPTLTGEVSKIENAKNLFRI